MLTRNPMEDAVLGGVQDMAEELEMLRSENARLVERAKTWKLRALALEERLRYSAVKAQARGVK